MVVRAGACALESLSASPSLFAYTLLQRVRPPLLSPKATKKRSHTTPLLPWAMADWDPQEGAQRDELLYLQVKVLPWELSVDRSSYRGRKGNRSAEALETSAHRGWVCEPTGRNTSEARAGLESDVVSADRPE